jgi:hypothetical protein
MTQSHNVAQRLGIMQQHATVTEDISECTKQTVGGTLRTVEQLV